MSEATKEAKRPRRFKKHPPATAARGATPERIAAGLGFIPPHQRPEVQERMRAREEAKQG